MNPTKNIGSLSFFYLTLIANILLLITIFFLIPKLHSFTRNIDSQVIFKIVNTCKGQTGWRNCYGKEIASYSRTMPYASGLALMHEVQKVDKKTLDCHVIAHSISNAQTQQNPDKWKELLGQVTAYECVGGFIHGILETYAGINPDFEINEETIPQICDLTEAKGKSYCSHMLGHLLALETSGDILAASDICHKLQDRKLEFACHSGAFMENITRDFLIAHQQATRPAPTWEWALVQEKLCRQATEQTAQKACWGEMSQYYYILSDKNPARLWEFCSRSPIDDGRDLCFLHGVTFIAGDEEKGGGAIETLCQPYSGKKQDRFIRCISTIIEGLINRSSNYSDKINNLCTNSTSVELKEKCFYQLGQELKNLMSNQKTFEICQKVPEEYKNQCRII